LIDIVTLTDGGQTAPDVAARLASFLSAARQTLDIALYDFKLSEDTARTVIGALHDAVGRGVKARMVYNVDHRMPIAVPPPPATDPAQIAATGADAKQVYGVPDLMHHKYVVRDGSSVWSGSTNWTEDSWTREENVIVTLDSPPVAQAFARDFQDLWTSGTVAASGKFTPDPVMAGATEVRVLFCPGRSERLVQRITGAVKRARRVRVASPVITSGPILGALNEAAASGHDIAGVYDSTQMAEVFGQWRADEHASWKIPAFQSLVAHAPFGAKVTTPYAPGSVHDYMHAKVTVADDVTFVGSYNLSHSGEENAENVLEIKDAAIAGRLATFIDELRARYPSRGAP
jgi:phosphatidylserine/phosphatidylglycerophosphate/cardiolipin synthase-like enzyme